MEGEGGVGLIGVGVHPSSGEGGVVDGEELEHLLACEDAPVHHAAQVHEVAASEVCLRTHREHRDGGSGPAPVVARVGETQSVEDIGAVCRSFGLYAEDAVVEQLPTHRFEGVLFQDYEFILEGTVYLVEGDGAFPYGIAGVVEAESLMRVPAAERRDASGHCQHFVGFYHRGGDAHRQRVRQRF